MPRDQETCPEGTVMNWQRCNANALQGPGLGRWFVVLQAPCLCPPINSPSLHLPLPKPHLWPQHTGWKSSTASCFISDYFYSLSRICQTWQEVGLCTSPSLRHARMHTITHACTHPHSHVYMHVHMQSQTQSHM